MWRPWAPPFLLRKITVYRIDDPDTALEGVLWRSRGPWFVLRNAAIVKAGTALAADGEIVIHRANIAFVQVD